jgi:hypothetical protein
MARSPTEMTLTEYAKHRGCSHVAVLKAVKQNRIAYREEIVNGKVCRWYDAVICDAAWEVNTREHHSKTAVPPPLPGAGRPVAAHVDALHILRDARDKQKAQEKAQKRHEKLEIERMARLTTPKQKKAYKGPKNGKGEDREESSYDRKQALTERMELAKLKKLEAEAERELIALQDEAKALVSADTFEELFSEMVAHARDRLMSVPVALRVSFPLVGHDVIDWIQNALVDALSGLAKLPERDKREIPETLTNSMQ